MCLAIAPYKNSSSGIFSRLWRTVSLSPLRLLSFCALIHSVLLGGLLIDDITTAAVINIHAYMFVLSFGLLAPLAFGYLLTSLPGKYSLSPVHYGRYNTMYLFMMCGLGIFEAGLFFGNHWIFVGELLLIPAWLIGLQSMWNLHNWANSEAQQFSRPVMLLLLFHFICLCLSFLGQIYHVSTLTALAISSSIFLVWPVLFVAVLVLVLKAPAKGRIISL